MEVIANNIANANSTRSANGGPFRRQDVVFASVLGEAVTGKPGEELKGVRAVEIVQDPSPPIRTYMPGHPDADKDGFVSLPNVKLPLEMVNLLTATRAYEANLKVMQAFKTLGEQAIAILRS